MVDARLIPGGRLDAPPIGMNAFDRDDLPSGGVAIPAIEYDDVGDGDRPENSPKPAERRPESHPPESGPPESGPGGSRPGESRTPEPRPPEPRGVRK